MVEVADPGDGTFPLKGNLNKLSREEIAKVFSGSELNSLIENRPYKDWEDLSKRAGIDSTALSKLQASGVTIGS